MTRTVVVLVAALACPAVVAAQSHRFELGAQVTTARSREFDRTDAGIGARFSWHPRDLIGADAEVDIYPRDFPDRLPFSRGRVEGFFGATAGPRLGRVRPFAKLRPGLVAFRAAPQPIACILIFPPPLGCALSSGRTLVAIDIGGGIELFPADRTFVRVDAGDRLLKYPAAFDRDRVAHTTPFWSHDVRVAVGAGV